MKNTRKIEKYDFLIRVFIDKIIKDLSVLLETIKEILEEDNDFWRFCVKWVESVEIRFRLRLLSWMKDIFHAILARDLMWTE